MGAELPQQGQGEEEEEEEAGSEESKGAASPAHKAGHTRMQRLPEVCRR